MANDTQTHVTDGLTAMRKHEAQFVMLQLDAMKRQIATIEAELCNVTPGHTPVADHTRDLLQTAGTVATSVAVMHGYDMGLLFASRTAK